MQDKPTIITNSMAVVSTTTEGVSKLDELSEMLMESMRSIKDNPGFIPQAETMAMVAGRVIDIQKTKIAAASLVLKAQG
jgi:hypothetical protein